MGGNQPPHTHILLSSTNPSSPSTHHCECKQSEKSASSSPFPSIHCDPSKPSQQMSSSSSSSASLTHTTTQQTQLIYRTPRRSKRMLCFVIKFTAKIIRHVKDKRCRRTLARTKQTPGPNSIKAIEKFRQTTTKIQDSGIKGMAPVSIVSIVRRCRISISKTSSKWKKKQNPPLTRGCVNNVK